MKRTLTPEDAKNAVYGGCILGGGGGGLLSDGEAKAKDIFAHAARAPELISIDDLDDETHVACVALVGAPSATDSYHSVEQMITAVELLRSQLDGELGAIMTNENGASTTINGWLQAASLGIPVLDCPANGRAHPTGSMGAMNLHALADYESIQAFAGGKADRAVSGMVKAKLGLASDTVRAISVQAGGMVTVCRNPVTVDYVRANGAAGGITQAIELGAAYHSVPAGPERIAAVVEALGATVVAEGAVQDFSLQQQGGFDVGIGYVNGYELTFWNEYMTVEHDGKRLATFPDLIMTLDQKTGTPVVTAQMHQGQNVVIITVPQDKLLLSSTMHNTQLLQSIEPIINKPIVTGKE